MLVGYPPRETVLGKLGDRVDALALP